VPVVSLVSSVTREGRICMLCEVRSPPTPVLLLACLLLVMSVGSTAPGPDSRDRRKPGLWAPVRDCLGDTAAGSPFPKRLRRGCSA
jgi:hypothetical protein